MVLKKDLLHLLDEAVQTGCPQGQGRVIGVHSGMPLRDVEDVDGLDEVLARLKVSRFRCRAHIEDQQVATHAKRCKTMGIRVAWAVATCTDSLMRTWP